MEAYERQFYIIKMLNKNFFRKFTEWEYWPSFMFYIPNLPYAFYLALKAKNFTFYSAVNPGIENAGNGTESKYKTLELIPNHLKPKSLFVAKESNLETVFVGLKKLGIKFPLIAKPDIGFRGMLVEKISSKSELNEYLKAYPLDTILQEFIDLPNECGIFYYRLPDAQKGVVSSLTLKSFLHVVGDGNLSLKTLVNQDERAKHYIKQLETKHRENWNKIPNKGEKVLLSAIGNHSRGTQFIAGNHLIDNDLKMMLDEVSGQIKGWYYGRIDVKYKSMKDLKKGKNFVILEINGTISEPTHMYDSSKITYFQSLKIMRNHWKIIYQIAVENIKNGVQPARFTTFWLEVVGLFSYMKKVSRLSKRQG